MGEREREPAGGGRLLLTTPLSPIDRLTRPRTGLRYSLGSTGSL